ncbi:nucleotidyltransferase family protein [Isoptericola sp. b490]|uniref:nucleotidyltransferase family protein n=1 Tax=Actinotalea lenta TaxID=3064654 RepID=UPI002713A936|nr:nucleotidyltransferase family protein [Isoptericola sp. b490]MDO8119786.1 nucleotidyltransferase family protein [Isoptericola sp. b490]
MSAGALGLLLAAGAGRRMGTPKALVGTVEGGTWAARAARVLADGGCTDVLAVLGARAAEAAAALPVEVATVVAENWRDGMGASLAAGLRAAAEHPRRPAVAVVHLVDLPDVPAAAVRRVLDRADGRTDALVRATYAGRPGHPVVLGRAHWDAVAAQAGGERGANRYLAEHDALTVECGDLAEGRDVDTPEALRRPAAGL